MSKAAPLIYVVACEPSADQLGLALMNALVAETGGRVRFAGIGGPRMTEAGLKSLFDPEELALLGIFEVLPSFRRVLARVAETIADIKHHDPDVLVTIDSWGFTGRIHQRLAGAGSTIPRIRYVAPQVWAWRPGRAKQLARWIHHLMALFPFEPPLFTPHGLATTWVGHPVVESDAGRGHPDAFRKRHGIAAETPLLMVLPGSRRGEINRLAPVFGDAIAELRRRWGEFTAIVPTVPFVAESVRAHVKSWTVPTVVVNSRELADAAGASRAAIAASGTVSLELAMAGLPHVIAYRVNPLSALAFRVLRKTRYVNLVNVLLDRPVVPELLQRNCNPSTIADAMASLLEESVAREQQRSAFRDAVARLAPSGDKPSRLAARTVLSLVR